MSEAVRHLMAMTDETVSAKYIAPILHMSESVIVKYAKDGTWDADRLGNFVISGGHVKFFRKDFLQKCGFVSPDPPELTTAQALEDLREELHEIRLILRAQLSIGPALLLEELRAKEKTAGAATPTD
jgi:hypothetical protein